MTSCPLRRVDRVVFIQTLAFVKNFCSRQTCLRIKMGVRLEQVVELPCTMSRVVGCTILRIWLAADWLVAALFILNDGLAKMLRWVLESLISHRNEILFILRMVRSSWRKWAMAVDLAVFQFEEVFHHRWRTSCYLIWNAVSCFRWSGALISRLFLYLVYFILRQRFVLSFLRVVQRGWVQFRENAVSHFIDGWILRLFLVLLFVIWLLVKLYSIFVAFERTGSS